MKKIINISLALIFTFSFFAVAKGQYGIVKLSNGITVFVKTEIQPTESQEGLGNIYSSHSGNVINRILTDKKNMIYFGYDLLIEKMDEEGKFKVSIKPLSTKPKVVMGSVKIGTSANSSVGNSVAIHPKKESLGFDDFVAKELPNYPKNIIIEDGDTIKLDLLVNPQNNSKISDSIQITTKDESFNYSYSIGSKTTKDYSINDVLLQITRPQIYINDKEYKTGSSVAGNINWTYISGKGRFIFSVKPQLGYNFQKIGVIRNNEISFEYNGDKYRFVSKSPILGKGGNWNLWVLYDPNYQPEYQITNENPFVFGAAGKVSSLFKE